MANARISNSLSYFLEQALILEKNSLETVSKVSDAVTSQKDTVTISLTDPNNPSETITYSIPSFGYLKSEIERLDRSIKSMSNIDSNTGSRIRLSDGTYRKIIASKLDSEAPTITTTNSITNFNFKSNWLFEDMMNPYLYADVDLSNCIPIETERVLIQRYIINCVNTKQLSYFDSLKNNSTKIEYKNFLRGLLNNGITYILDENYYDIPPIRKRYTGEFEISRILENTLSSNGKNILGRIVLKSLLYTDNNSGIENTIRLSKNDILEIKENPITTRYLVTNVDHSTNEIKIKRLEGYTPITNKTVFGIYSKNVKKVSVEIPVSFDKREVIFVKAIDPDSNIPSNKWSPGIAFHTNELKYISPKGEVTRLDTFYKKNVVDFGNIILSYSKDFYPSVIEGIKPAAPILHYDAEDDSASDFKIVQINKQLSEGTETNTFKKLIADKELALSQINNNNKLLEEQKEFIQTTKFTTTTEKLNAQNKLAEYVKNQSTYTSLYSSIVNQIKAQYAATYIEKPKYRVRGFWSIPSPKISKSSGPQQIIQFKVRYRYLSESGVANKEEEFTYLDGSTNATGRFSNWNEILTPMRRRVKGIDGKYSWEKINTSDPDQININQLDLPIQNGEQIEIQIKSISEAGFPTNPMESDWSDSVIIAFRDFPELQGDDISEVIAQNRIDASVANIMDSFTGNANAHMSSSFYTNDKYFAHNAESITSGFLSPEQTPITLYDKLYDLQNQITAINEYIEKRSAAIEVKLIDGEDNTKIYTLNEGGTTYINAGSYVEDKNKIDSDKRNGAIITKTYFIDISSEFQSGLELISKIPGDRLSMCPNTISEVNDIISNEESDIIKRNDYKNYDNILTKNYIASDYYKTKGRYDLVPINLSNSDIIDYQICSPNMYQSAQCKGQFIYSRFRNVSDSFDMYANTTNVGMSKFDPNADFEISENIYKFINNDKNDDFWIERFNFYRPSGENGYKGTDINEIKPEQKETLFKYITKLYDNLTGSTISSLLQFSENEKILYMWKYIESEDNGETYQSDIVKNIITNTLPENTTDKNVEVSNDIIEGIYYKDGNVDFNIYQIPNYKQIIVPKDFSTNKIINCEWTDDGTTVYDKFKLDDNFYYTTEDNITNRGAIKLQDSYDVIRTIEKVLNRLPKTFRKSPTAIKSLYNDTKVIMRLQNLTNQPAAFDVPTKTVAAFDVPTKPNNSLIKKNVLQKSLVRANKIAARTSFDTYGVKSATMNKIEPKLQSTYGYSDLGKILNLDVDGVLSMDDGSYVTTHKIGYEEIDRYRIGTSSCDSYLFLSPLNHSEIQVNGDSNKSYASIGPKESLKAPIIYQYRMEDYNGSIFGNDEYRATDAIVKNTKYANIIGIDIWTNDFYDTPKQYDIVVYSTYNKDISRTTGTITKKLQ